MLLSSVMNIIMKKVRIPAIADVHVEMVAAVMEDLSEQNMKLNIIFREELRTVLITPMWK